MIDAQDSSDARRLWYTTVSRIGTLGSNELLEQLASRLVLYWVAHWEPLFVGTELTKRRGELELPVELLFELVVVVVVIVVATLVAPVRRALSDEEEALSMAVSQDIKELLVLE